MYEVVNKDELYHHGIKGQKWGVRRFQNPDGTLTEAGKERYFRGGKEGVPDGSYENSAYAFTKQGHTIYDRSVKKHTGISSKRLSEIRNNQEFYEQKYSSTLSDEALRMHIADLEKTEREEWTKLSKMMASGEVFTKNFIEQESRAIISTNRLEGANYVKERRKRGDSQYY